tara:strand:+ start:5778 stop:6317 length:540 start_codon:yes stop_codon:yes gene_type:complete
MLSIFNNSIVKGLIFVIGTVIITFITYLLKNVLKSKQSDFASPFCNVLPGPFTVGGQDGIFNSPSLSSAIIGFTSSYLIFPMQVNNELNPSILTFLLILMMVNGVVELQNKCTNVGGVVLGVLVGVIFGILYYSLIVSSGHKDLVYFNSNISNNVSCKKPGKQKFKCIAYHRGTKMKIS